jgi:hypothetical protein
MGERKVISHYYPPDFDPLKLPRGRKSSHHVVTMALPMRNLRCIKCGEYLYQGTKFNATKVCCAMLRRNNVNTDTLQETVVDKDYLGIRIFRSTFRCPGCSSPISIETDPKNSDYICSAGATRGFESRIEIDENKKEIDEPLM